MLISLDKIREFVKEPPKNLLQLGAYTGDDLPQWKEWGCHNVFYVEPNPELFKELVKKVTIANCCNYAVSSSCSNNVDFHKIYSKDRTNLGCSSLLTPTKVLDNPYLERAGVIKVDTITVDQLNRDMGDFDWLVMDVEGHEINCLKGAINTLHNIKGIISEFSLYSRYEHDCCLSDLDDFLCQFNFKRVATEFATEKCDWGDCLFIKK